MSFAGVLVYSERYDLTLELLTPAVALVEAMGGGEVTAVLPAGAAEQERCAELGARGAHRVVVVQGLEEADAEGLAAVLEGEVRLRQPAAVLTAGTKEGVEATARMAQRLKVACAHRCTRLGWEQGALWAERAQLGRFVARERLSGSPAVATVPARRFEPPPAREQAAAVLERSQTQVPRRRVRVVATQPRTGSARPIEKAKVVVSIGRGLKRPEDLHLVESLARALGGQVGASRPMTDHLQWLPADVKVGLSGHTVRPDLYVACGISGQLEHLVGMRESKLVVAINLDPGAPIFKEADLAVVGDLYALLPALCAAVARLGESGEGK